MADTVQGKPGAVVPNDIRLAAAALLVASDGEVLGQAAVLSSDLAVTTAEVAQYARSKLASLADAPTSPFGPLGIAFPQFGIGVRIQRPSPNSPVWHASGVLPLRATIEAIDPELGFATIRFSGKLLRPLPTGLLGAGDTPGVGIACDILYSDPTWTAFYQIAAKLETPAGARLRISLAGALDEPLATALAAAPVFAGYRFIGIVLTASSGVAEVLSVDGMALSRVTPAVRSLLPWIDPVRAQASVPISKGNESQVQSGSPTQSDASLRSAGRTLRHGSGQAASDPTQSVLNAEVFSRLSPSAKSALERANAMRIAMGLKEVHMEQLMVGLFEKYDGPTRRLFSKAQIDAPMLLKIIHEVRDTEIPTSYPTVSLQALPPLSEHANKALQAALRRSSEQNTKLIRSRHLLYGALSVDECGLIKALQEHGVRKEDIYTVLTDDESPTAASDPDSRRSPLPEDVDGLAGKGFEDAHPVSTKNAETRAAGQPAASGDSDAELWERMTPSARRVFERAMGMMREATAKPGIKTPGEKSRSKTLHMEFLIAALFESQKASFASERIDRAELRRILRQAVGTTIPEDYQSQQLEALPETSEHVRLAIAEADRYVRKEGARRINDSHLLYGAMFVQDCRVTGALADAGMRWQHLKPYTEPDDEVVGSSFSKDQGTSEAQTSAPPVAEPVADLKVQTRIVGDGAAASSAAPTPKVAPDIWSVEDRLGYEAYARTIASLITHKETVPPLTIGIKAPWGAGKTSLMKRVQHLLDGDASLTERNEAGLKQMWQQSAMTFWSLLRNLKKKTIIVDPDRHDQEAAPARGRARELLKEAVRVDALKPKESAEGRSYGISPRITVWFNAWRYQTSEQVWAGMARCIISQIMARMNRKQRELFWLRLRTRRVNAEQVRWRVWEAVLRQVLPFTLVIIAAGVMLFGALLLLPLLFPALAVYPTLIVHLERGIPFAGIFAVAWRTGAKLSGKAAEGVRDLVREPDYEDKVGYLSHVESDIRDVLKLASVTSKQPLVVFVDDLDRCAPNKVAEVVEAINLFLCGDYPNCIFVLGMEPGMVAAALQVANKDVIEKTEEMGLTDRTVPLGWRFMEKIVQLPITIPPPTTGGRDSYVESLTGFREWNAAIAQDVNRGIEEYSKGPGPPNAPGALDAEQISGIRDLAAKMAPAVRPLDEEQVKQYMIELEAKSLDEVEAKSARVLAEAPAENRQAAAEASKRMYARTFSERDPAIADFVKDVAELVDGNPRQIKRYVNVFRFYSTLRHSLRVDGTVALEKLPTDKVLAKFVALSIQWPHAVDSLRKKDRRATGGNGNAVSRLQFLEAESKKMTGDDVAADATWKSLVGKDGMGLGIWAEARGFREFLSRGESLCEKEGHGLW